MPGWKRPAQGAKAHGKPSQSQGSQGPQRSRRDLQILPLKLLRANFEWAATRAHAYSKLFQYILILIPISVNKAINSVQRDTQVAIKDVGALWPQPQSLPASDLTLSVPRTGLQGLKSKRYLNISRIWHSSHSESSLYVLKLNTDDSFSRLWHTHNLVFFRNHKPFFVTRWRHSGAKVKPKEKNPHHIHVTLVDVGRWTRHP